MDARGPRASGRQRSGAPSRGGRPPALLVASLLAVLASLTAWGCGNEGDPFSVFEQRPGIQAAAVNPADGTNGVSVNTLVTVAFSVDLDPRSVTREAFNLVAANGIPVARSVRYDPTSRVVTIRPSGPLEPLATHQVVVQGVEGSTRSFRLEPQVFQFTTGEAELSGAPEVIAITPVPNQQNVNANAPIVVEFSEPMDPNSVIRAFSISDGVAGTFSFDTTNKTLTFTPGAPLPLGRQIVVQISQLALDPDGVPLKAPFVSTFRTPEPGSFQLVSSIPADGATTASPGTLLRFTFSEPVDRTTIATNFAISNDMLALPAPTDTNFTFANADQVVFYNPALTIPSFVGYPGGSTVRTTFTVDLVSAISGLGLPRPAFVDFQVEANAPNLLMTQPLNGATEVQPDQIVRFTFDESLDTSTVTSSSFSVTQGAPVSGTITFEDGNRTVVFAATGGFQNAGVPVVVNADTTITDLGGTPLAAAVNISFSIDTSPPFATAFFPASGATQIPVTLAPDREIRITFNESLDQSATQATFTIAPNQTGGIISFPNAMSIAYNPPTTVPPINAPAPPDRKKLLGATTYTVTVTAFDLAGNSAVTSFNFTTDNQGPATPVGLIDGMSAVTTTNTAPNLSVVFGELMDKDRLAAVGTVTFRQVAPMMFDIPVTLNLTDTSLDFTPTTPLAVGASYEVVVDTAATDLAGNALGAPFTLAFQVIP